MSNDNFEKILNEYRQNGKNLEKIRVFLISNLEDENYLTYIEQLLFISIQKEDKIAEAFFHAAKFFKLYTSNLSEAKKENDLALNIYYSLNNYESAFGFLSTLNNAYLYNIMEDNYDKAFDIVKQGFILSKKNTNTNYYSVFSVNYVFLLNEAGLYDKSFEILIKNIKLKNIMIKSNFYQTIYLYISQLILLKKYEEARGLIHLELLKRRVIDKFINSKLFDSLLLRLSIAINDSKQALESFNDVKYIVDNFNVSQPNDLDIYLDVAKYYYYINDFENALKMYQICYQNSINLLGRKREILEPLVKIYSILNMSQESIKVNDELMLFNNKCSKIIYKLENLEEEKDVISTINLNKFKNDIKLIDNFFNLSHYLKVNLKKIFNAQYVDVIFNYNSDKRFLLFLENQTIILNNIDLNIIESYNEYPVNTVELPFKIGSDCKVVYILVIKTKQRLGYIIVGYDEDNLYTHQINKNVKEEIKAFLANKLTKLYRENSEIFAENRDILTGVKNRYALLQFNNDVNENLENFYVMTFKVDKFPKYNNINYLLGNKILVSLADVLLTFFSYNYTFRYEGNKFICIFKGNYSLVEKCMEFIFYEIHNLEIEFKDTKYKYTISAGASFVSSKECLSNNILACDFRLKQAQKKGDSYIIFFNKELQVKCQNYLINLKEYLKLDKFNFDLSMSKDYLLNKLREIYSNENVIFKENTAIINYICDESIYNSFNSNDWKFIKQFANDLGTSYNNFDSSLAYILHKMLFDYARKNNLLDEIVEEMYYLGVTSWQLASYLNENIITEELLNEYKQHFDEMNNDSKVFFLRAYASVIYNYKEINLDKVKNFVNIYMDFLVEVEANYSINFNYRSAELYMMRCGTVGLDYFKQGKYLTKENIDFCYQCACRAMDLIEIVSNSNGILKNSVKEMFYGASYYKGLISQDELLDKLRLLALDYKDDSFKNKYETIIGIGCSYLEYLECFGLSDSKEFKDEATYIYNFILDEIKTNTDVSLDRLVFNYMTICSDNVPDKKLKDMLLKLTVNRHIPTVIHVFGVCEIVQILLDSLLENNQEYFVGILDNYSIEDVNNNIDYIKAIAKDMAILHDIGKHKIIRIINNSSRRLFDFEFEALKSHTSVGYDLIKNTSLNKAIKGAVLYHHKWYNNNGGYPEGKDESNNKPLVDILSVADSIDAATDKYGRSYARAKSLAEMVEEFNNFKDTRYSKVVVDALNDKEVFDKIDHFINEDRTDLIYSVYKKYTIK